MNRQRAIVLWIAAANLALVSAFPPYDYLSLTHPNLAIFGGFHFVGSAPPNSLLNHDFLLLEGIVILIDAGIAWLLLRNSAPEQQGRFSRGQRAVMWLVAINLVLVLLFPPFEDIHAISRAALPSFEGFYFVFGNTAQKQIVATLLYIEVALILINGGLLWLLFARQRGSELTAEQKRALARALQARQRRD